MESEDFLRKTRLGSTSMGSNGKIHNWYDIGQKNVNLIHYPEA